MSTTQSHQPREDIDYNLEQIIKDIIENNSDLDLSDEQKIKYTAYFIARLVDNKGSRYPGVLDFDQRRINFGNDLGVGTFDNHDLRYLDTLSQLIKEEQNLPQASLARVEASGKAVFEILEK